MGTSTTTPPSLHEHELQVLRPWFAITGLDATSPQWNAAWAALIKSGLATAGGLKLWPTEEDGPDCGSADTRAGRTIRAAVEAGARYAATMSGDARHPASTSPPVAGVVDLDAGLGVEVALGLLQRLPELVDELLSTEHDAAVNALVQKMRLRVAGVFRNAPAALNAYIALVRATARAQAPFGPTGPWHPLVDLILTEASNDEVFAEHVFVRLRDTRIADVDFEILSSDHWMIVHTGKLAIDVGEAEWTRRGEVRSG